jgi:hypothetical protein
MNSLEYMLVVCSERAKLDGHVKLAEDLSKLATASRHYEDASGLGETELSSMLKRFQQWYGPLMQSDEAKKRYAERRREMRIHEGRRVLVR